MYRRLLKLLVILFSLYTNVESQNISSYSLQDTILAKEYNMLADTLAKKTEYDSAINYLKKAAEIYESLAYNFDTDKLWSKYVLCRYEIGTIYRRWRKPDESEKYISRALEVGIQKLGKYHPDVAAGYNKMGILYWGKWDENRALKYENKALQIYKKNFEKYHIEIAKTYNDAGILYSNRGNYDLARDYMEKAFAIKKQIYNEDSKEIITAYRLMGYIYMASEDYDNALIYYKHAENLALRDSVKYNVILTLLYRYLGICYSEKGELDKALRYCKVSLKQRLNWKQKLHFSITKAYLNVGNVFLEMQNYDSTQYYFDQAKDMCEEGIQEHPNLDFILSIVHEDFGRFYLKTGEFDKSLEHLNKALDILLERYARNHYDLSSIYREIGNAYCKKGNYDKALEYYQKSLISLNPDFNDSNIYSNPDYTNTNFKMELISTLTKKAEALEFLSQSYKQNREKIQLLTATLELYNIIADIIDYVRIGFKEIGSKLILANKASNIFDKSIRVSMDLYRFSGNIDYIEQAFKFSEKGKAATLAQSLQEVRAKKFSDIPDSLLSKVQKLYMQKIYLETEIDIRKAESDAQSPEEINELEEEYFLVDIQYKKLLKFLEMKYPRFYNLKYETNFISLTDLQNSLTSDMAILQYFIGKETIYLFTITSDSIYVSSIKNDSNFAQLVGIFSNSLKSITQKNEYIDSASKLYQSLIKPAEFLVSDKNHWIIIPDGNIHLIPFEALLKQSVEMDKEIDFSNLNYVLLDHNISYQYSASLFLNSVIISDTEIYNNEFIGFAPVFKKDNAKISNLHDSFFSWQPVKSVLNWVMRDGKNLDELKFSESEVNDISKMFENKRQQTFIHTDASEENFKGKINNSKFVHVATHGIVNSENPKLSNLIFSQRQDSTYKGDDGFLYSGETYNLNMNADLLVLSACQTGTGKIEKGEGLMSLTRGFLYSGAKNIIASLWKVFDEHSSQLMIELYRQIISGKSYSAALRKAKLKMINNESTARPQSWASFILIGQ